MRSCIQTLGSLGESSRGAGCLPMVVPLLGTQAHTAALPPTLFYSQTHLQHPMLSQSLVISPPHTFLNMSAWFPIEETGYFPEHFFFRPLRVSCLPTNPGLVPLWNVLLLTTNTSLWIDTQLLHARVEWPANVDHTGSRCSLKRHTPAVCGGNRPLSLSLSSTSPPEHLVTHTSFSQSLSLRPNE